SACLLQTGVMINRLQPAQARGFILSPSVIEKLSYKRGGRMPATRASRVQDEPEQAICRNVDKGL
ncbi:MAG: hypothetical protein C4293_05435, partial [Nitrospiraceae bacterium]